MISLIGFSSLLSFFFLCYFPFSYSPFLTGRGILWGVFSALACFYLARSSKLILPSRRVLAWFFLGFMWMSFSALHTQTPFLSLQTTFQFLGAFILFLAGISWLYTGNSAQKRQWIYYTIIGLSLIHSLIAIVQYFLYPGRAIGVMGNSEFLSFFLAFSLFLVIDLIQGTVSKGLFLPSDPNLGVSHQPLKTRSVFYWVLPPLLLGLFATFNKSTFFVFFVLLLTLCLKRKKYLYVGLLSGLALSFVALFYTSFIHSVLGRCLVWGSSLFMMYRAPLFGTGLSQYSSYFLQGVFDLFHHFPGLSPLLGTYSGVVGDAHLILLQFGVELGILGFVWAVVGIGYLLYTTRSFPALSKWVIYFILFKMMITVTLFSLTSLAVIVLAGILFVPHSAMRVSNSAPSFGRFLALGWLMLLFLLYAWTWTSDLSYTKGMQALRNDDLLSARYYFLHSLLIFPDHPLAQLDLAYTYYLLSDLTHLNFALQNGRRISSDLNMRKCESEISFLLNRREAAKKGYLFLHQVLPDHLEPPLRLALIEFQDGHLEASKRYAQVVLDIHPRHHHPNHPRFRQLATEILKH